MTKLGEHLWDDYYAMRAEVVTPECDPHFDIEARLNELEAESSASDDDFDLLADDDFDREASRTSLESQKALCVSEHQQAEDVRKKITPAVKAFRLIEHYLAQASIFATAQQQMLLLVLLFVAAAVTTLEKHHIAFRPKISRLDYQVSLSLQLLANGLLAFSVWLFRDIALNSSIQAAHPLLINGITLGSTVLAFISLYQLFTIPKDAEPGGTIVRALLSVPLYCIAMLIFAFVVYVVRGHPSGLAIYFNAFFEHSGTYLDVALYLWAGMLLKQTQLGERVFSLFTPWKLPAEILAFVAVVVMAVPTAYTGASSIIILAMGVVVYSELRKVGTRRQLALATTAMSGSSGIVLKPCLLVVIISIL
ncbi:MAG: C4-dicarboxylate ABC transporter, partial [Gammaproteobacteria bacterium]